MAWLRKRIVEDISPEEREARIAELRARRRARLRVLAIRSAIASLAVAVLLGVLLYWLLQTVAGRDVLLAQIQARLPAGSTFTWSKVEGPVAGPLTLHDVDFRYDDIRFTAKRIFLDPDLRPLLGKRLRLDALQVSGATLDVPQSDEPFELPKWPEVLPQIAMPLDIQADTLVVDGLRFSQGGKQVLDVRSARGGIDIGDGLLKATSLAIDSDRGRFGIHGEYSPRDRYRTDLMVTAVFPAALGRTPARLGLLMRGDREAMDIGIGGAAPAPVRASISVRGQDNPRWNFQANSASLDPALLGLLEDPLPLAFDLRADARHGAATLQGRIEAPGQPPVVIERSRVRIAGQVLTVEPLAVQLLDGRAQLRGTADFTDAENPTFKFAVNARGVQWGEDQTNRIGADADLGVAGQLKAWAAIGRATLVRQEHQAQVDFDARGDDAHAVVNRLQARMPSGRLDASGELGWAPRLRWDLKTKLAGFDPGYFLADWNGDLNGEINSRGQARDPAAGQGEGYDADFDVPRLTGRLRGRALDGRGKFALHGTQGEGDLQLALGSSRVQAKGKVGDRLDIDGQLQPLQLDDLLPDANGRLSGTVQLRGPRDAPDIQADLAGSGLKWNGYAADALTLRGRLPWQGSGGDLLVSASALQAGVAVDEMRLHARGAVENLQLEGDARNAMGALALSGQLQRRGGNWQGALEALRLAPSKGDAWQLQGPARFTQSGNRLVVERSCLSPGGSASLCVQADWPQRGVIAQAQALPLSLVHPWLPENSGRPLQLRGEMSLDANLRPRGNAWEGEIHLASPDGGLKLGSGNRELLRYDNFSLDVTMTPQTVQGRLGTGFKGDGYVDARFNTGWDDYAPLKGDLYFHNSRLFWMELLSPDLVRPRGQLAGHIGLAGTRGQPALSGEATLKEFTGELPALGISLDDGSGELVALADGSARIQASMKTASATGGDSTGGVLGVSGTLGRNNDTTPLALQVRGDNVLVSDTKDLRAVASPDIAVGFAENTIKVSGKVAVPSARIDVERLDDGVSVSEDVVVLDPADPERAPSSRLDLDLALVVGDDVQLKGYGLDGSLAGTLNVRSRPGRDMAATGRLDVDGRYTAYGQKLQITRGALSWSNDAVSNPDINIRAEREVISAGVTAGIDVTGRASSPRARVWSNPETSESDALAYLVLGRSLGSASSRETQQINAANSALSAGAGLLASQLGAKIGLDDAGVLESRTLGGSVFGVGKYLSPKLYVSYGVSMIGSGSVVTLKYLLRKGFDAELETSTIETRGSINWRKEK